MTKKQKIRNRQALSPAAIMLQDGTVYHGHGFGAPGAVYGEIVFNTGMTGYQEVVTDPSYHGQMVTFTYPLIGNYGVNNISNESDEVHSRAVIVREAHNLARNCTAEQGWVDWLAGQGVVAVAGVDTRAITRRIRREGAVRAACSRRYFSVRDIADGIEAIHSIASVDLCSRRHRRHHSKLEIPHPRSTDCELA